MPKRLLLIGMPGWATDWPSHSLAQVAGLVKGAGWECRIKDLNVELSKLADQQDSFYWSRSNSRYWLHPTALGPLLHKYRTALETILCGLKDDDHYDIVAFSVNSFSRYFTLAASSFMRSLEPNIPILFGGYDCFTRRYNGEFFKEEGAPDIICQGEAEIALPEFLKEFDTTSDYRTSVKGFVYNVGGEIVDTGEPELPFFADSTFVADWSQFDFSLYDQPGDFGVFFSRGCTHRCTFCSDCNDQRNYRGRKPEDVVNEIKAILPVVRRYTDQPIVHFSDQLINGNIRALSTLCDLIIKSDLSILWHAQLRFRPEMTWDLLEKMYAAGCRHLSWGFEHASQRILNLMKKDYDLQTAKRVIIDAYEIGIQNYLTTIVGYPSETISDLLATIIFVFNYAPYTYFGEPSILAMPPNSQLHAEYAEEGAIDDDMFDWESADHRNTIDVRMFRKVLLRNAIENKQLAMHSLVGWDDIEEIDFNGFAVASDIADALYSLWAHCRMKDTMAPFLSNWISQAKTGVRVTQEELKYWRPENIPANISLENWFINDKNEEDQKKRIFTCLLEALRDVRDQETSQRYQVS